MRRKTNQNVLISAAAKGSIWTRLSFLIMGIGCVRYKQYVRGLIYFLTEIGFFYFFRNFALQYLSKFNTLGTETQKKVWNDELQIFQRFPGDNSMLILLYSVLSLAVVLVFFYIWYANIRDSWNAQQNLEQGRKIDSFRDDLRSLTHERFHMTLLSMPMLTLVLFTLLPIIFMILIAFTNFDADHQPPGNLFTWVGVTNVTDIFLGNEIKTNTFFGLLGWTIVWAILATFTNYILGMLLAVAINSKMVKLKQVWRTCFIIAIAIPQFVSLLLISRALEPAGAVNVLLQKLGLIDSPLPFLLDPTLARIVVVVVNMWIGIPYTMMTFSGVLMNIPAELYESAEIDGAGPIKKFTSITLPYMIFVTAPATITTFVTNFNNFNVIYLLTGGGPFSLDYYQAGKTDLLVTWLYKLTVNRNDYSLASTIGIFIFILVSTCSLIVYNRTGAVQKEDQFQ
ncbi:MAG: sugar ABC transporter permease [Firmicutes bacterium]|nr:sugar ABC transporter permease [Bacillota bacterium]